MSVQSQARSRPELDSDLVSVLPDGLLSRVRRPCAAHGGECPCVGVRPVEGCLVFWCESAEHTFTVR
ncbi:MAG: hypothetical protein QOK40_1070 [Miltoncostaeaceae bacterium]|jgi:hypothetical protein|nr:hypothetical protein [Miltoncostaeaceae bacterium]